MYDFDTLPDRRGWDSLKWDILPDELPMWVADMDFLTAPEIADAIAARVSRGAFGYGNVTDDWYDAYIAWWGKRHHLTMEKRELVFCTGVIPAISSTVRKLTTPNENVVIQTPVYNVFFNCIQNNGARVLENPLVYDGTGYHIDFDDLEKKLSDPQTSLMLLCNPHNPTGNLWSKEELARIGALAYQYGVTVISDEIHCDLTSPGYAYTPFASVSEECRAISVTCIAPTKAFNLAGIQTAAVYVPDGRLRHKVWRALNTDEVAEPNSFAVPAAVAAFTKGEAWLTELCAYLEQNRARVGAYLSSELPKLKLVESHATYLLWIDVSAYGMSSADFASRLRKTTGLFVSRGTIYGAQEGRDHIRLNIACPASVLEDGLARLKRFCQQQ